VEFSIQVVPDQHSATLYVRGEVDLATAGELSQAGAAALHDGQRTLIVDLRAVSFMDSTGLAALVALTNHTAQAGGHLSVRDPSPRVREVLRITGLDTFLTITTTGHSAATPAE
jgi:anti-sigma B factor antagonist